MIRIAAKHRRIFRIALRLLAVSGFVTLLTLFLLAQRKPAWYTPIRITSDLLPRLRREVTIQLDDISRKMVERKPFVVTWSQKQLTERLAAFRDLWPESRSDWPAELSDPVVKIDRDSILVGAFFQRAGWRAIVGLKFALDVAPDNPDHPHSDGAGSNAATDASRIRRVSDSSSIHIRLIEATAGSLSAPRWLIRRWLTPHLDRAGGYGPAQDPDSSLRLDSTTAAPTFTDTGKTVTIDQLFNGLLIENDFTWPNGRRPFRIAKITTTPGAITLHIEPR